MQQPLSIAHTEYVLYNYTVCIAFLKTKQRKPLLCTSHAPHAMAVNSSRVIREDRVAMRRADRNSESSRMHMYIYMCRESLKPKGLFTFSPPCGGSISWQMDEQTKKNHYPLVDMPPVAYSSCSCIPRVARSTLLISQWQ